MHARAQRMRPACLHACMQGCRLQPDSLSPRSYGRTLTCWCALVHELCLSPPLLSCHGGRFIVASSRLCRCDCAAVCHFSISPSPGASAPTGRGRPRQENDTSDTSKEKREMIATGTCWHFSLGCGRPLEPHAHGHLAWKKAMRCDCMRRLTQRAVVEARQVAVCGRRGVGVGQRACVRCDCRWLRRRVADGVSRSADPPHSCCSSTRRGGAPPRTRARISTKRARAQDLKLCQGDARRTGDRRA